MRRGNNDIRQTIELSQTAYVAALLRMICQLRDVPGILERNHINENHVNGSERCEIYKNERYQDMRAKSYGLI